MAANRYSLTIIDPSNAGGPTGDGRYRFSLMPVDKGQGRSWTLTTRPWQPSDPKERWRKNIHGFGEGMRLDKIRQHISPYSGMLINRVTETYSAGPIDGTPHAVLIPPPLVTTVTLANGNAPTDGIDFNGLKFILGGRYMYYFDPTTNTATQDKDFGVGKAAVSASVFNNELIVAMGETEPIWKRTTAGVWTQATDATYAIALGVVKNLLWRASSTNSLTNCTTTPLTLANWGPTPAYSVGDSTFPVHSIVSYGGTVWAMKGDGAYQADPQTRFINQVPQATDWPDANNCKGSFTAQGFLWVPTIAGLYRIKPGQSMQMGPELCGRPAYRWRVRGGVYWGGAIYLVCDDLAGVSNSCVVKMFRDDQGISSDNHEYLYHHWADLPSTAIGGFICVAVASTNPKLLFGTGNNCAYITMNRGGTVTGIPDDPNYAWATAAQMTTGVMMLSPDMATTSNIVGTEIVCKVVNAGESLTLSYSLDDTAYANFLTTGEGGGTAPIAGTTDYQSIIRYALPNSEGQQMQFKLTGALTTTSTRWEIREWWIFGYSHTKVTDLIELAVVADESVRPGGIGTGQDRADVIAFLRNAVGGEYLMEIEDYETGRPTRFQVAQVAETEVMAILAEGGQTDIVSKVTVTLARIDRAGLYANP